MTVVSVQPIAAGYAYGIRLTFAGGAPPFPIGCTLRAEVRDYPGAPGLAGLLTSDSGLVSIIDPATIELFLAPALTGALGRSTCAIDLVRTDISPVRWLGIQAILPVMTAVTRAPGDALAPGRIIANGGASVLATIAVPPGMTVVASAAIGPEPWSQTQVIAAAPIVSTAAEATPMLRRVDPLPVSVPTIVRLFAGVVLAPAIILLPAPPPQVILPSAAQAATSVPPPAVSWQAPQVIRDAGVAIGTMVGSPLVNAGGVVVIGPAAISAASSLAKPVIGNLPPIAIGVGAPQIATTLPAPAVTQPSSTSYAAAGYVADGYVGAS